MPKNIKIQFLVNLPQNVSPMLEKRNPLANGTAVGNIHCICNSYECVKASLVDGKFGHSPTSTRGVHDSPLRTFGVSVRR